MGGLAGWIDFQRDLSVAGDTVESMTETMRWRGPDTKGVFLSESAALGYRGPAGTEGPVSIETGHGTVVAALVGQIYNTDELRREIEGSGRTLRTGSPVELLLQSFLLFGSRFVERLNGMFGFAILDGRSRRLHLGRDRLGVKPLYYFEYPGGLLFATEPKGIMPNALFEARLDVTALPIVLQPRLTLPGETPLVGLREVPPAHVATYSPEGLSVWRYWGLVSAPHDDSFDETAARVRDLLEDIVARQLPGSGPTGAMLSGGLDSTSIAALATRTLQKERPGDVLETFCIRFDSDEAGFAPTELRPDLDAPHAAAAAEFIGSRHATVTATMRDLLDAVPATRRARDLPGWGQFDASMYVLFRHMRDTCPVALTGEAADEFFGGYPYFFKPELIRRPHFPWLGDGPRLSDYLSPELTAVVDPREDERERYAQLIASVPRLAGEDRENARMREILFLGMSGPLAVILDRKDRMSMAHGLEVRLPYCDHRLVEYLWNVPWSMKSAGGVKGLLKAAMADVVPPGTLSRKKSAYPHVQSSEYDRAIVRDATWLVNDPASPIGWMFDRPRLDELIQQIAANGLRAELPGGSSGAHLLIHLLELHRWIEENEVHVR